MLTDKIYHGQGVIDLLLDISPGALAAYLAEFGQLLLGIDVNENASGNESSQSQGIALEQIELTLSTTAGDFTFSDFYTSTSAMLVAAGTQTAAQYYTVFGTGGSNAISGGTSSFAIDQFDDVIRLDNIEVTGEITSAQLAVTFLDVADTGPDTGEEFFDYSNGFEDFAVLAPEDADALEAARVGVDEAPASLTIEEAYIAPVSTPGAPAPPWLIAAALVGLAARRMRTS